ncbi:MAG: nitrogen regulation protein NR(I) [bacterium]
MSKQIWIVDDDTSIRWVLSKALEQEHALENIITFTNADDALQALNHAQPAAIISDVRMPGTNGMELLATLNENYPQIPVIIMTANTDLDSALSAYAEGAFEYLPKPFEIDEVTQVVRRALEEHQTPAAKAPINQSNSIIGSAPSMQELFRLIGRLSKSSLSVLINGETGTGKELVARALHDSSLQKNQTFVAINTAAIPDELLESELFGHEKGAFTGANTSREGRFEQANGGTLFLDEIGDMPAEMQTRLLRVLASGEFYRVGGHKLIKVNVRIIAASHQDLPKLVLEGRFREDLYHRLNVVGLKVPPLRDRRDDIPELITHFLSLASIETSLERKELSPDALTMMHNYSWPGNVRELENVCRRLTVMAPGHTIHVNDLPENLNNTQGLNTFDWIAPLKAWITEKLETKPDNFGHQLVEQIEKILLEEALIATSGKKQKAAQLLGWGRNTLTRKIQQFNKHKTF